MPAQPEVVIIGKDGVTEHVFPAGFDPKRAAAIVRQQEGGAGGVRASLQRLSEMDASIKRKAAQVPYDLGVGALKGAAGTAVGLGSLFTQYVPGVSAAVDALYQLAGYPVDSKRMTADPATVRSSLGLDPSNRVQSVGRGVEQVGEFFIPGAQAEKTAASIAARIAPNAPKALRAVAELAPHIATQAGASGAVTAVQGGDARVGAVSGAVGPVLSAGAARAAQAIGDSAIPLVRAAIKPTVTAMKQQSGASVTGISTQANALAKFIVDKRLTTPDKAEAIIVDAERELQRLVQGVTTPTDTPQRAARYLDALKRSAAKQGLGASDVAAIVGKQRELLKSSPLSEDVFTTVMKPSPSGLVTPSGQPVMVPTQVKSRALRTDVAPAEALDVARSTSRWSTRRQYGELKGASVEADKAVERASRDAVKVAVPGAKDQLQLQGQAIKAKQVLDRKAFREANRDAVSLPAHVVGAAEIAQGRVPIMAMAANWLRNNQLKAGIWADRLASAMKRNDVREVSSIMNRLGVSGAGIASQPASSGGRP